MNEIIEVTAYDGTFKVLLPIKNIKSISSNPDGTAFVETGEDNKHNPTGINIKETYAEVKKRIAKLILLA